MVKEMTNSTVQLVVAVVIMVMVVFPACTKLQAFYKTDYPAQFDNFVDEFIDASLVSDEFEVRLAEGSSIVGFGKEDEGYKFVKRTFFAIDNGVESISSQFKKPVEEQCIGKACICLCSEPLTWESRELSCQDLRCRTLDNVDIANNHIISFTPHTQPVQGNFEYWNNGFLYGRSIDFIQNGLTKNEDESVLLKIERRVIGEQNLLGFCNADILRGEGSKRQEYFGDKCIITEFDEAEQYEKIAENPGYERNGVRQELDGLMINLIKRNAIEKYKQFIVRYETGQQVEESYFRIAKIYFDLGTLDESLNTESLKFIRELLEKFPETRFRADSIELLTELKSRGVEVPDELMN